MLSCVLALIVVVLLIVILVQNRLNHNLLHDNKELEAALDDADEHARVHEDCCKAGKLHA